MSVIAAHIGESKAIVIADTGTSRADGSNPGQASKVFALPHINAVLAARGLIQFLSAVAGEANSTCSPTFDALRASMSDVIRRAYLPFARAFPDPQSELILVGLSESAGAMACDHYRVAHGKIDFGDYSGALYLPGESDWNLEMSADDPDRLLAMARLQVQRVRNMDRNRGSGGFFTIAELEKDAITIRRVRE